jgi:hypothetical protein
MTRFFRRWLAPALLLLCGALPCASADDLHPGLGKDPPAAAQQTTSTAPADAGDKPEKPAPTFAYFVAVGAVIAVMCILCVPSRKAESSTARR